MSPQAPGHEPNTSQWSQHRSGARFQNFAKSAKSFQCRKTRHEQSLGGRLPHSPSYAPKQVGNSRVRYRGIFDGAIANPPAHKRMTGKCMLHVFGRPGFLAKAWNHLGLRGDVLDAKCGLRHDVTQPPVLTRIRQGRLRRIMCRSNDLASTTTHRMLFPKLFPPVLPSPTCFIVLACLGFWNTRVNRGCGTCRKSRLLRHSFARPGPWQIFVALDDQAGSERCFWTAEIHHVLLASVLELLYIAVCQDKNMFIKRLPHHAQSVILHVPTPFIFRACHDSHHERTTIPENTSFEWNLIFTQRRDKGYWCGSY